jgi:hypothetical protein
MEEYMDSSCPLGPVHGRIITIHFSLFYYVGIKVSALFGRAPAPSPTLVGAC